MINTKAQALFDYILCLVLLSSPWLFDFTPAAAAHLVTVTLAVFTLLHTLFTKFELALAKLIPLKAHLLMDMSAGILLAVSPLLLGFSGEVFKPHLVFGLAQFAVALLTDRVTYRKIKVMHLKTEMDRRAFRAANHEEEKGRRKN